MAININKLIAAPMLQDSLVDNATELPLANGTITLYQDASRTTLKNWYYQSGSPGNYSYITLPNPLTLSGVGTIADPNGNDTIPFYYPYDENDNVTAQPYYIVVRNSNGQQQFVRQNFPFNTGTSVATTNSTLKNFIANPQFWRNSISQNAMNSTQIVVCADQHDGFSMPDMQFFKNATGAPDTITFTRFNATEYLEGTQNLDVTPEFYLNLTCAGIGTETSKYIQIPLSLHQKTLGAAPVVFTMWARCNSGVNRITINILQFNGTGVASPAVVPIITLNLTSAWQKFSIAFTMPNATDFASLGAGGDDAFYLHIDYQPAAIFNIDIAKPSMYIGNVYPPNDFQTYDNIDAIINSPRTGDIKGSVNYVALNVPNGIYVPYGWLLMNDTTIGNTLSAATQLADRSTWPLYSLLWNNIIDAYCPVSTGRGVSAYADFTANKTIALPKALTRVFGTSDGGAHALGQFAGADNNALTSNTQLPAHTHSIAQSISSKTTTDSPGGGGPTAFRVEDTTNPIVTNNTLDTLITNVTGSTGSSAAFSILQPTTYINYLIKL